MNRHGDLWIVTATVAAGAPVFAVSWMEPTTPKDSGYLCWAKDDDIDLAGPPPSLDFLVTACLHCLIDGHTEAGVLLDRARVTGLATADA